MEIWTACESVLVPGSYEKAVAEVAA